VRTRSTVVKGSSTPTARSGTADLDPAGDAGDGRPPAIDERLFGDERFGVLFVLWLVGRATVDAIDRRIEGTGLSADEFPVYCLLDIAGPLTPSALGAWMAAPPTTVSALVKRLERRGHAVRRANTADRRSYRLELTEAGRAAQGDAIHLFTPLAAQIERELGRGTPRVRADLIRLRRAFDAVRGMEST
jgi:DNA-binding MarR family transcriptional regulator